MGKPAIPAIPTGDPALHGVLSSLKENVETVRGVRNGPIAGLAADASHEEVIAKVNELISRLNL